MKKLAALLSLSLLPLAAPSPAQACSPPGELQPGVAFGFDDGDVLPPNVREIGVHYLDHSGGDEFIEGAQIVAADGTPLDATVSSIAVTYGRVVRVHPLAPLPAGTYELRESLQGPEQPATTVATFEVEGDADESAPTFSDFTPTYGAPERVECDSDNCCGPFVKVDQVIEWAPASDDNLLGYYLGAPGAEGHVISGKKASITVVCEQLPQPFFEGGIVLAPGTYQVTAVDVAGNRTVMGNFEVADLCADTPSPPMDGGPGTPPPAGNDSDDGGCSVGGAGGIAGAWLALAALLAARRRRRA